MACARCDFYLPKDSSRAQLFEAKDNLPRMLAQIPLTDHERDAVEEGAAAVERLIERLADVPTPTGLTPRQLSQSGAFVPLADLVFERQPVDIQPQAEHLTQNHSTMGNVPFYRALRHQTQRSTTDGGIQ